MRTCSNGYIGMCLELFPGRIWPHSCLHFSLCYLTGRSAILWTGNGSTSRCKNSDHIVSYDRDNVVLIFSETKVDVLLDIKTLQAFDMTGLFKKSFEIVAPFIVQPMGHNRSIA